jgi:hypothetical protein
VVELGQTPVDQTKLIMSSQRWFTARIL